MQNSEGIQKGPQDHAEGQHGSKTHGKFLEQLHSGSNGNGTAPTNGQNGADSLKNPSHHTAAHRLVESRQQHDAAEKRSEKTRLNRAQERHHLNGDAPPRTST
jgi:hypothetical protein